MCLFGGVRVRGGQVAVKFKFGFQIEMDDGVVNPPQIVVDGTELLDAYLSEGDDSDTVESLSGGQEIAPIGVAKFDTEVIDNDPIPFGFQTANPGDTPGELEPQLRLKAV